MWLWKKFWNTDIIGKIYILIILFIVIVATITVVTRYRNASTNQVVNDEQNEIIQDADLMEQNTTIDNTITVAEVEVENIEEDDIKTKVETKKEEKSIISTDNKSTQQTSSKEEIKVTVNKEQTNNNETQINKKEEVKQEKQETQQDVNKQQEQKKEQEIENNENSNEEQQETNKQEDKKEVEEKEETTQEVVRTVKRNDTYIQKMKNYITTNDKSSYSIVVDESIVNNTYGFTYSEFNMSGYIGCYSTYRIYAQDYYVNGEYVETRCYID